MQIQVDTSGRLDQSGDTVFGFSDHVQEAILVNQTVWDECLKRLTGKRLRRGLRLFAACVFLLIKDHLEEIAIDQGYSGHEQEVRWIILNMVRRDLPHCVEKVRIRFAKIGRKSSAHELAWRTLRRERKPDGVITSRQILSAVLR